jgi:hypothetical protein
MDFSCALKVLKLGKSIQRESHQDVFYYLKNNSIYIHLVEDKIDIHIEDYKALLNSQDILATDWTVVVDNPPLI